jgi:hypothetical protein
MTFACPAGHASDESDYCSVCGAAIPATAVRVAPASAPSPARAAPATSACPVCGEPRTHGARFCEVCRYDFIERKGGPPPAPSTATATATATSTTTPTATATATATTPARWDLVVTIDPSLDTDPDPAVPAPTEPERIFAVELTEMLVGRRDDTQNIRPAIPVHDPGASRRHAKFLLGTDGNVSLHDLASTNGTKHNGQDVVSGSVVPLKEGDEVTLGRWTRIRLRVHA